MKYDQRLFESLVSSQSKEKFIELLDTLYVDSDIKIGAALEGKGSDSFAPYIIFDMYEVTKEFVEMLRRCGENAWKVMTLSGFSIHSSNTQVIEEWGYPDDYVPQMLNDTYYPPEMRFDIAVNPEALERNDFQLSDFKVLEVNSATPSFWWETFVGNEAVCNHFGTVCPNLGYGEVHMMSILTHAYSHPAYSVLSPWYFCIPYFEPERNQFSEDTLNMDARMGFLEKLGVTTKFRYIEDLIFETDVTREEVLKDSLTGEVIKNLFLHYPSEWLIDEAGILYEDELASIDTVRPWDYLNNLVLSNTLCKLPSIMGDTIQNKSLLAFVWDAAQEYRFDEITQELITTHFLPTFCFQEQAEAQLHDYWEKPVYGREGAGIKRFINGEEVFSSWMPDSESELNNYYQTMHAIYQQHSPLPQIQFKDTTLSLMFTVYVGADGVASGVGLRASADSECISAYNGFWYPLSVRQ